MPCSASRMTAAMEYEPILPLKAIAFQIMFLMVAVAIEAGILRQRLRLGFKQSVQYATVVNLASVVVGWIAFLVIEPLSTPPVKAQIISYVFFDRLMINGWTAQIGGALFAIGLVMFFVTFFIKAKGLELILRSEGKWAAPKKNEKVPRDQRYSRARAGQTESQQAIATFIDAVIQANAASFTAILILLLLRETVGGLA
jgi:hypothetical protein